MNNNVVKIVFLAVFVVLIAAAVYVYLPVPNKYTRITVVGESQTKVSPDTAVITFSVVTQSTQAVNAQQENAKKTEAVRQAIEAVADKSTEIKTANYNLSPEQDYYSGKMPKILGYEVRNTITVSGKNLEQLGAIIDAATKAGANSVDGISFVLRGDSPAQGDAIGFATKQAMTKAESIAKSMNGRIVRIVETIEGGSSMPTRSSYAASNTSMLSNHATTPIQAGSLDMNSQITLVADVEVKF